MLTDFELWLERNKERLITYTTNEIADLAVACGFDRKEIGNWVVKERFHNAAR